MHRLPHRMLLLCALVVSALGVSALGAQAKTSPTPTKTKVVIITGGTTTIKANMTTVTFLASHKVGVTPIAPATLSGASVTLPVKGGVATTKKLDGVLLHRGAVKFTYAKKSLTLRHITLYKVGKQAHLAATFAGKLIQLGKISGLTAVLSAKTATVSGELHLSGRVAHLIDTLIGHHVVGAGYDFGSFTSTLTLKLA
jgi:hypothetical protein